MRLRSLAVVPVALGMALIGQAPISAAPSTAWQEPEVAWVNTNVVTTDGGETAHLLVKYRCWGEGAHLWGSVKQGEDLSEENTSSAAATSWRETPEGPVPTCNGKWQTERVLLQATEDTRGETPWSNGVKAPLTAGEGWMQFVIFAFDPAGGFGEEGPNVMGRGADQHWVTVRGATGR